MFSQLSNHENLEKSEKYIFQLKAIYFLFEDTVLIIFVETIIVIY